ELHRTVLNRCLPRLIKHLDFIKIYLSVKKKAILDDVTLRDIKEQTTRTNKIMELIERVKQRGRKAYDVFKECLGESRQTELLDELKKVEAKFQMHETGIYPLSTV
ncbi:hypothetical protein ACJMK2_044177, partial [Sinanodonta woodiana]